ncbi:DUF4136 domain-containing protein [Pseudomonas sp. RIT-PI-S]|uniref:DUF4136 domain-containing protein n=1 Tax=Pseudomonas sp. RIT-PI-S TaxID=3035295 RepID=UPI0021DA3665|nr:DUF4136 domain-containing protein [Pseudomonas sp. RIT-PI-S]
MRAPLLLICTLTVALGGCQTERPNRDYDTTRDFAAYRSWSWQEPALQYRPDDPRVRSDLTEQRLRQAVAEQLDQRGLRQAQGGKPDLKVQAWLIVDNRQQQITTSYGGPWGPAWGGPWIGQGWNETRSVDYRVATLQLDLLDGRDGKLVWRASQEQVVTDDNADPEQRAQKLRQAVARLLQQYPPR